MYTRTLNLGFDPELDVDLVHPWVGSQNFLSWLESGWSGPVSKISNAIYIQEIRRLSTLIPNDKKLYNIADFIIVYLFIKFWLLVAFLPCGDMWCSSC